METLSAHSEIPLLIATLLILYLSILALRALSIKKAEAIEKWKNDLDKIKVSEVNELNKFPNGTVLLVLQSKEGLAEVCDAEHWEEINFAKDFFLRYGYDTRKCRLVVKIPGNKLLPEGKTFQVMKFPEGEVLLQQVAVMFG